MSGGEAPATTEGARRKKGVSAADLESECRVFCRYLVGVEPSGYVVEKYVAAHGARKDSTPVTSFEAALVRRAARGVRWARICDAYARLTAPRSVLRRKLSMLLAILESSPGVHRVVETVDRGGRALLALRLAVQLGAWLLALALGLVLLTPVRWLSGSGRRDG